MTKRKNEYSALKTLLMFPVFSIVCPSTRSNLQIKSIVEFTPDKALPNFVDIREAIMQKINSKEISIEAAAELLVDIFAEFAPKHVLVKVETVNNNSYFTTACTAEIGTTVNVNEGGDEEEDEEETEDEDDDE